MAATIIVDNDPEAALRRARIAMQYARISNGTADFQRPGSFPSNEVSRAADGLIMGTPRPPREDIPKR